MDNLEVNEAVDAVENLEEVQSSGKVKEIGGLAAMGVGAGLAVYGAYTLGKKAVNKIKAKIDSKKGQEPKEKKPFFDRFKKPANTGEVTEEQSNG